MKTSRELTIYYVENKCPSKVISTIVYSYEPAFKWAARHLKDDFFVWSYFISHRPQDSNILHTSTQEILEEIRLDTLGDVETKLKELHSMLSDKNVDARGQKRIPEQIPSPTDFTFLSDNINENVLIHKRFCLRPPNRINR